MNYPLVGAFVLVLGTVLIGIVLWLASGGAFQKKLDLYLAIMDESVSGLSLNAPVKYNGVEVGKVQEIRLDKDNPERVILLFALERGTPVREDTVAVLKVQGLTGIAYVELSGGARNAPLLAATPDGQYPVIKTKPSLSARLENILTNVAAKLESTSNNINSLLSAENLGAFKSSLADIAAVSRTIAARKDAIDAALANTNRTMTNLAQATANAAPVIERIGRSAEAVEKMGNEMAVAGSSASKTIESVGTDVKRFTADALPEFQRLLGEIAVLAASLRRLSEKMEGSPGGLLMGRRATPPGPGETAVKK